MESQLLLFSARSFYPAWGQDHESRSGPVDAATGDREMPTYETKETKLEMKCGSHMPSSFSPLDICQILKLGRGGE